MPAQTLETEIQRLQCLQALGITVYHPRFRLPGAKASVQGPWPDPELAARANPMVVAEVSPAVTTPAAAERRPSRIEVDTAPAKATPARRAPAVATTPNIADTTPASLQTFQLLFLQVDDELAIVNQIPALARPQLQDKQTQLLVNLLRWLGKSAPAQAPRLFRWPLPGLEHMAANMSAETSLLHFLEQASSERGFRYLLQLGPQAVAPVANAWQAFATHSLDEMLALPALKREVWQTLLPLHALLHASS